MYVERGPASRVIPVVILGRLTEAAPNGSPLISCGLTHPKGPACEP